MREKTPQNKKTQEIALPAGCRTYEEGQAVPARYTIFNYVLVPIEMLNHLATRETLDQPTQQAAPEILPAVFQLLYLEEMGTFAGLCQQIATLGIQTTQTRFTQALHLQGLWESKPSLRVPGVAIKFLGRQFKVDLAQNKSWGLFKRSSIESFSLTTTDTTVAQEPKKLKATGDINN
ncbi:hypothetical protein DSO57_1016332 [Entomophthora muscae]|uniref:Uncharacterized protein n=1 Tax=Entomophthora muscae TaxID=34485 RepID=A0ACC2TG70_9FUNG|nr:hypothetical protein DSO57_1016332 [Entomophthora muscae]